MGSPSNGQDTVGQGAGEAKTAKEWTGLKIGWSGQESNYDGLSHKGKIKRTSVNVRRERRQMGWKYRGNSKNVVSSC